MGWGIHEPQKGFYHLGHSLALLRASAALAHGQQPAPSFLSPGSPLASLAGFPACT